jgi:uncharacterized membrane protein YeaQ/YmgE (transglycosylase-associated protein family)
MDNEQMLALAAAWANDVLVWVGFGTIVGLLAKAIMPGKDPGGAVATLAMGIGGTIIGCGILSFFTDGQRVTPISPTGFAVGTGGAFLILFFYKLLGGYWFKEDEGPLVPKRSRRAARARTQVVYDE